MNKAIATAIALTTISSPAPACYYWSATNCAVHELESRIIEMEARERAREKQRRESATFSAATEQIIEQMRRDEASGAAEARRQHVARNRAAGKPKYQPDFSKPITATWCQENFGALDERPMYMACMMSVGR